MRSLVFGLPTVLLIPFRQGPQSGGLVPLVKIIANMEYALALTQSSWPEYRLIHVEFREQL
jgi:hypothetical protein